MTHDHEHRHDDHPHGHDHDHGVLEGYHVQGGAPALDIGGDIGALVATMDRSDLGTELHLRSDHEPPLEVHTGVWERDHGGTTIIAAVFAELLEGSYRILHGAGTTQRVEIHGGRVTMIDLRS